ncbi:AEC family transporter [Flindersiella endophytica]
MTGVALLSVPVFGVVALGWVARRTGLVTAQALDALGRYAFQFALPALVFRLISAQPLDASFDPVFYAGYLGAGALVFAGGFAAARRLARSPTPVAGACAATATVGNLGFLGPPLMLAYFGDRGAGPLAMAVLAEVMVLLSIAAATMSGSPGARGGAGRLLVRVTASNPIVVAIAGGAGVAATGSAVPGPLDGFLGLLGASAAPTALFALGGSLAGRRLGSRARLAVAGLTVTKLVVYPLLVWCVLGHLLVIDAPWVRAGVVLASLPPAGSTYVLAQRFAAEVPAVPAAITMSTLLSAVTVPATAWLVLR